MRAREFHQILSTATGATLGEIDQRTRFLRGAGQIASGKRGLGAPDITPFEMSSMVLAMVSRRATDAEAVYWRASDLVVIETADHQLMQGTKLVALIAVAIQVPEFAEPIQRIEIEESGDHAWVRTTTETLLFTKNEVVRQWVEKNPDTYDAQYNSKACRYFVIGGGFISQLALDIAEEDEAAGYGEK